MSVKRAASHVTDIEEVGAASGVEMLGEDTRRILPRHGPTDKGDDFGAQGLVVGKEGGLFEVFCLPHRSH